MSEGYERPPLPTVGTYLEHAQGSPVALHVQIYPSGKGDFRVSMSVSCFYKDGKWVLVPGRERGLAVFISLESHKEVLEDNNNNYVGLYVRKLRVVRHNDKGSAIIAEVVH